MIELFIVALFSTGLADRPFASLEGACESAKDYKNKAIFHVTLADVPKIERITCKRVEAKAVHWEAVPEPQPQGQWRTIITPASNGWYYDAISTGSYPR